MTSPVIEVEATELEQGLVEDIAPIEDAETGPVPSGAEAETPAVVPVAEEQPQDEQEALASIPVKAPRQVLLDWWLHNDATQERYIKFEAPQLPEPVWIERLDFEGMSRVGFLAATNKEGMVGFGVKGHLRRLATAMFFVALNADEEGKIPLFQDVQDALVAACSMSLEQVRVNILLFDKILEINPSLLELNPKEGK